MRPLFAIVPIVFPASVDVRICRFDHLLFDRVRALRQAQRLARLVW